MKTYTLEEICVEFALPHETVETFIDREWIIPLDMSAKKFDDEDLGRMRLILELKKDFNINEEGVDVILHLLDQLYTLKRLARLHASR